VACTNTKKDDKGLSPQDALLQVDTTDKSNLVLPGDLPLKSGMAIRFDSKNEGLQYAATIYLGYVNQGAPAIIIPPIDNEDDVNNRITQKFVDYFRRRGMIVMTYDRAGCGQSKGSWDQTFVHNEAKEVEAAARELARYDKVDKSSIGVLIYGRNTIVSLMGAAKSNDVSFYVSVDLPLNGYKSALMADANFEKTQGKPARLNVWNAIYKYVDSGLWDDYSKDKQKLQANLPSDLILPNDKDHIFWESMNEYKNLDYTDFTYCLNKNMLQIWGVNSPSFDRKLFDNHTQRIQSEQTCKMKPTTILIDKNLYPEYTSGALNQTLLDSIGNWLYAKGLAAEFIDGKTLPE
jgi:alpha/beta superfamily hydrolase